MCVLNVILAYENLWIATAFQVPSLIPFLSSSFLAETALFFILQVLDIRDR